MEYFLRVYIALYYYVSGLHNFLESSESPSCLTITRVKRIKDNDVSVLKLKGAFNYVRSKDTLTSPMRAPGVLQAFDKLLHVSPRGIDACNCCWGGLVTRNFEQVALISLSGGRKETTPFS